MIPLRGNGPKYNWSAAAAAEIVNLDFDPNERKAVRFGRILFVILEAMYKAEDELRDGPSHPLGNRDAD